ncbi:hypothetical protein NDU88_003462 [Pleurodeles waltl]|uniref:Uncharacterized protein n=1 Tax=Pleurodeles waltl TaxID=8319 RepID=A0AAV7NGR2_PLEWA|nr:hypothetical protein NDU88_003462 [Pleurodeles waltl]
MLQVTRSCHLLPSLHSPPRRTLCPFYTFIWPHLGQKDQASNQPPKVAQPDTSQDSQRLLPTPHHRPPAATGSAGISTERGPPRGVLLVIGKQLATKVPTDLLLTQTPRIMGQARPACWGHQLSTTWQHEQPGPLSPHLQALTTSSILAGPTISLRGPNRPVKPKAGTDVSRRLPLGPTWPRSPLSSNSFNALQNGTPVLWGVPSPDVATNRLCPDAAGAPLVLKRAPQVQPVLLVPRGVSSPLRGPVTAGGPCRKGAPVWGPGLCHARCVTPRGRAAPRPRPTGSTHTFAAQLRHGLLQKIINSLVAFDYIARQYLGHRASKDRDLMCTIIFNESHPFHCSMFS